MSSGFYQTNNEILKFDLYKDINQIRFNHYISRKENLNRSACVLPRGQFYMAINTASQDLDITVGLTRGLIKKFVELNIITNIYTPPKGSKKPSIWQYNSVVSTNNDINNDINNDEYNDKQCVINMLQGITNNEKNNDDNNEINNSKKDNIKTEYKNNIYSSFENEQLEYLWKLYPKKIGKGKSIKFIIQLIKRHSYEEIQRTIERYMVTTDKKRETFSGLEYQNGSSFFKDGYMDYLDENYIELENNNKDEVVNNESNSIDSEIYTRQKF